MISIHLFIYPFVYLSIHPLVYSFIHFLACVVNCNILYLIIFSSSIFTVTAGSVEISITVHGELLNINETYVDEAGIGTDEKSGKIGKMRRNARTVVSN